MAVVRLDDGKVNVISHRVIELLHAALDRSLEEATAVAIIGREGKLSAGFDLTEMTAGIERTKALVGAGGHLLMRIYGHPQPVVLGVTGHALAAGALLALSCDVRIGGDGPAKIGLNETAIGMGLPHYAVELAQERLSTRAPPARRGAGGDLRRRRRGGGRLPRPRRPGRRRGAGDDRRGPPPGPAAGSAYRHTKLALHQALIDRVEPNIDPDMASLTAPGSPAARAHAPAVEHVRDQRAEELGRLALAAPRRRHPRRSRAATPAMPAA